MKITPDLLKKYAEGSCSPAEKRAVEQWTRKTDGIEPIAPFSDSIARKQRIWARVEQETSIEKKAFDPRMTWALVACVAILVVGVAFGLLNSFNSSVTTYTTAYGETQVVTLEDGTLVTLNANSKLILADNFGAQDRCVQFSGEGYFRVAKNPEKPFIIYTVDSKTQVLGTAFNLRAILNRPTTLTLEEGKVAFSATVDNEEIIVRPNQQVSLINGSLRKRDIKPENILLWTKEKLYFDNETLSSIVGTLEHTYGISIKIKQANLAEKTFRGVVNNRDLASLLHELAFVMEFQYTKEANGSISIY